MIMTIIIAPTTLMVLTISVVDTQERRTTKSWEVWGQLGIQKSIHMCKSNQIELRLFSLNWFSNFLN